MLKPFLAGTLIAGTLDILWAVGNAALSGGSPAGLLRVVASGPFPDATQWEGGGVVLGLGVHFALMAAMVAAFLFARERIPFIRTHTLAAGVAYGVLLWLVMYGLVLPLRFGAPFPNPDTVEVAKQLFAHIVLTGLAIGFAARAADRPNLTPAGAM